MWQGRSCREESKDKQCTKAQRDMGTEAQDGLSPRTTVNFCCAPAEKLRFDGEPVGWLARDNGRDAKDESQWKILINSFTHKRTTQYAQRNTMGDKRWM